MTLAEGKTSAVRKNRWHVFAAQCIASMLALVILKIAFIAIYNPKFLAPATLLTTIRAELLVGIMLSVPALRLRWLSAVLLDFSLLYCMLNMQHALLLHSYLRLELLNQTSDPLQLWSSFAAFADPLLITLSFLLIPLHRVFFRWISSSQSKLRGGITLALISLALSICLGVVMPSSNDTVCRQNPIALLIAALPRLLREATAAPTISEGELSATLFNDLTAFESANLPWPELPELGDRKFNVIVILLESTGEVSGLREGRRVLSTIDDLARTGVFWDSFYSPYPMTMKAIYALNSGLYPRTDLVNDLKTLPSTCQCINSPFRREGYRSAYFSADYFSYYGSSSMVRCCLYDTSADADSLPNRSRYWHNSWGIDDKALVDTALEWIGSERQSFFLVLQTILPHHPYEPPPEWVKPFPENSELDKYHNSLRYLDQQLQRLVTAVKESGLYDDTVFVLLGDHGEAFGQHEDNYLHSIDLYEENVRVPFLIANPRLFPSGQVASTIASVVDVAPTLHDLLRLKSDSALVDGVSLFRPRSQRMTFMSTSYDRDLYALRDGAYKFIFAPETNNARLFNLKSDPGEKDDVATLSPERVRFYRERVLAWAQHTRRARQHGAIDLKNTIDLTTVPVFFSSQSWGNLELNRAVSENQFSFPGTRLTSRGFGTHADSIIVFDIQKLGEAQLHLYVARDEGPEHSNPGVIKAEIWLDGKVIYESALLNSNGPPQEISIPVEGTHLALVARSGDGDIVGDSVDWIEPELRIAHQSN